MTVGIASVSTFVRVDDARRRSALEGLEALVDYEVHTQCVMTALVVYSFPLTIACHSGLDL